MEFPFHFEWMVCGARAGFDALVWRVPSLGRSTKGNIPGFFLLGFSSFRATASDILKLNS